MAGTLKKVELEGGGLTLYLTLMGTSGEEALKTHGESPYTPFQVHVCPPGCGRLETGERYFYGVRGRHLLPGGVREDWMTNLRGAGRAAEEDELAGLRERGSLLGDVDKKEDAKKKTKSSSSESKSTRKKKKKKKKEKKKRKKDPEDPLPGERKKEDVKKLDGRHPRVAGQKKPQTLFEGTGLDAREKIRARVRNRARKFVSKRKEKSSTSSRGSTSSSTTEEEEGTVAEGLYLEVNKARAVAERFPGILSYETLLMMQRSLLTQQGEDQQDFASRPVAIQYYRQEISRKASGALAREMLTLATSIDHLLRGRPAAACDVLCQRLKSCESMAQ